MEKLIRKTQLFKQLKYEDGEVRLYGTPCFISPTIGVLAKDKIIEEIAGIKKQQEANYFAEKIQARIGVEITGEKFGYAKTFKNKKDLLMFSGQQFELLGYGRAEWVRIDFENEIFIVRMKSPYAELYRKNIGLSKYRVDYWNAGGWAGCIEYVIGKKAGCIETSCIAQGKPYCEFVIRPLSRFDKKDPRVKQNSFIFKDLKTDLSKKNLGKLRF